MLACSACACLHELVHVSHRLTSLAHRFGLTGRTESGSTLAPKRSLNAPTIGSASNAACACARRCASVRSARTRRRLRQHPRAARSPAAPARRNGATAPARACPPARGCASRRCADRAPGARVAPSRPQQGAIAGQLRAARPADPAPRRCCQSSAADGAEQPALAGAGARAPAQARSEPPAARWRGVRRRSAPRGRACASRRVGGQRRPRAAGPERQHADQRHAKAGPGIGRQRQIAPAEDRGLVVQLQILGGDLRRQPREQLGRMQLIALDSRAPAA